MNAIEAPFAFATCYIRKLDTVAWQCNITYGVRYIYIYTYSHLRVFVLGCVLCPIYEISRRT